MVDMNLIEKEYVVYVTAVKYKHKFIEKIFRLQFTDVLYDIIINHSPNRSFTSLSYKIKEIK